MKAMAVKKKGSTMRDMFERMPMARLRKIARESHEGHDPEAARIFVNRVLDMEVERRTWYAHENPGYQPLALRPNWANNLVEEQPRPTLWRLPMIAVYVFILVTNLPKRGLRQLACAHALA